MEKIRIAGFFVGGLLGVVLNEVLFYYFDFSQSGWVNMAFEVTTITATILITVSIFSWVAEKYTASKEEDV